MLNNGYLVFDLETQRDAQSVGGWNYIAEMRMSVGVLWDSEENRFFTYREDQVEAMISKLLSGKLVIGFNHIKFDYQVLSGYRTGEKERRELLAQFNRTKNLDMLLYLQSVLGHRLKLDSIAKATLSLGKSADGLLALEWYKQYETTGDESYLKKIEEYCVQDVAVTRDVYLYGLNNKKLFYDSKFGIKSVEVDFDNIKNKEAFAEQVTLF